VLAVKWLANLLYPEVFDYDMVAEAQAFYQLFFHYELTQEEARALLANSTLRGG
jgi:iron complex transport system substrate-binding protein